MRATKNVSKVDIFNMKSGADTMKKNLDREILAVKAAQLEGIDEESGEERLYNYIVDAEGRVYSGNSVVVSKVMPDLIDMIDESSNGVKVIFRSISAGKGAAIALNVLE